MPSNMRSSIFLSLLLLVFQAPLAAAPRAADNAAMGSCLKMTVAANDIASFGEQVRQHYRIVFQNLCDTVRVVYWCAEHPSKTLTANSICSQRPPSQAQPQAQAPGQPAVATPLFAVTKQREFQWTFPQGTRIRFVDCDNGTLPTSDLRCVPTGPRLR